MSIFFQQEQTDIVDKRGGIRHASRRPGNSTNPILALHAVDFEPWNTAFAVTRQFALGR